jgi:hypothetical protein
LGGYNSDTLQNLVKDPIGNNKELRELSRQLYAPNGILRNTIDYMVALPTLDYVVVPMGKNPNKNKKNKELMQSVLQQLRHKEIMRDAIWRDCLDGICFYYLESISKPVDRRQFYTDYEVDQILEINNLGLNTSIISLSPDYTQIIGIKNGRYVIAFNLEYFNEVGESVESKLRKYPKEIREGYYKWQNSKNSNGNWLVLDNTKTIVHKISSGRDEKWGRALVLSALKNIDYKDYFIDSKRNILDKVNRSIVVQTFPEGKEKGTSALSKTQQEDQHTKVKAGLTNNVSKKGITFFSVAAGTKLDKIDVNVDLLDEKMERNLNDNIAMDLGFAASLLNGSSSGTYSSQEHNLLLVMAQVFSWMWEIANEIVTVINANVIKDQNCLVDVYYLPCSVVTREEYVNHMKDLYTLGHGSLSAWIASTGMRVDAYLALMEQEKAEMWDERFPPHLTSFVASGNNPNSNDDPGGRPTESNPTNPNTAASKTRGSNKNPKPSTK